MLHLVASRVLRFDAPTISEKKDEAVLAMLFADKLKAKVLADFGAHAMA